jgi:hypothetical protein
MVFIRSSFEAVALYSLLLQLLEYRCNIESSDLCVVAVSIFSLVRL